MAKHIALIGMMGAGKSTVAPILASHLGRAVLDVDALIETQEQMPIGEIFIAKGEAYFRRAERELISRLVELAPTVLSLGGGAFMWEATRQLLLEKTVVCYLGASLEVLISRMQASPQALRPLLNAPGVDMQSTLRDLLERRNPFYSLAQHRIETDYRTPEAIAEDIVKLRAEYD